MGRDEDNGMTILTRQACLDLLSQVSVGRVGVSIDALPVILPVHFVLFGEAVLFSTIPGTKLDAATTDAVVAFQADAPEARAGTHWSVHLQGIASEVSDEWDDARAMAASIKPWGSRSLERRLVRVEASHVTGRRFHIASEGQESAAPQPSLGTEHVEDLGKLHRRIGPDGTGKDRHDSAIPWRSGHRLPPGRQQGPILR